MRLNLHVVHGLAARLHGGAIQPESEAVNEAVEQNEPGAQRQGLHISHAFTRRRLGA